MTTIQTSPRTALAVANPLPSLGKTFVAAIREWRRRSSSRRDLIALGERDLHDLRLTRADAAYEARKPFWRE